jgi:fused signal recognition particle receptor
VSGSQSVGGIIIILVLGVVLVFVGVGASRRGARRTKEIARDLGIPEDEQLPPLPAVLPPDEQLPPPELDVISEGPAEAPAAARPRLRDRLTKTRVAFTGSVGRLAGHKVDDETWETLDEALLLADVGVPTTTQVVERVKEYASATHVTSADGILAALKTGLVATLGPAERPLQLVPGETNVWLFVGVNGVGKTTTIAKLAQREIADGHHVVLAAADTFRAAAAEQLGHWADAVGADMVRGQEGADPGSVIFDAMAAATSRGADLVLVDTAGRLHTKVNLMEELKKLRRIVERTPGALKEVLLVIDASTGQNGLAQARQFAEAVDVTGVVLTKLDGTAKGGIVLAIEAELGIPVKLVGVGESSADLVVFHPEEFVDALFA